MKLFPLSLLSFSLLASSPAFAKNTGYLFVSSEDDHIVTVLDGKTFEKIKDIKTSKRPRHLQFNPDKTLLYAACGEGESIDIIDVAKLEVTDKIADIEDPEAFDISPDNKTLYISLEDDGALGIIDLTSKKNDQNRGSR